MINFVDVYSHDGDGVRFLYELLAQRDPITNISHRGMPTFEQHQRFVQSKPYKYWYLVTISDGECVGSVYISKDNEIGIFIAKDHQRKGYGRHAVQWIMESHPQERFLANINPENQASLAAFRAMGFRALQLTLVKDS